MHSAHARTRTRRQQPASSTARPTPTDAASPTCRSPMCAPPSARAIASSGSDCSNRTRMSSASCSRSSACTIWPSRTRSPHTNGRSSNSTTDSLFVVLRTAQLSGADRGLELGETHVFVGPRYVISVRHGSLKSHVGLRARCEAVPHFLSKGPGFVLYALMDFVVDQYLPDRGSARGTAGGSRRRDLRRHASIARRRRASIS